MATRDTDSYIFKRGVSPNTLSVISSKNRLFAYNSNGDESQLGVLATFDPSESRTIEPVRGIGFGDHIAELVPGVTEPMSISVSRTALYLSNIYQIFGYKSGIDGIVRSLRHHRWPFDVRQEIVFSALAVKNFSSTPSTISSDVTKSASMSVEGTGEDNTQALITIYEACWLSDYGISFASDAALVQENVTINVSDVISGTLDPLTDYNYEEPYSTLVKNMSQRLVVPTN